MLLSLLPRRTAFYLDYCHVGLVFKSLRLYHALILVSFRKLRCTHLITRPLQYSAFRSTSSSFSSPSSLSTFLLRRQVLCRIPFCFLKEAYGTGVGYSFKHSTERLLDAMFCKEFGELLHYGSQEYDIETLNYTISHELRNEQKERASEQKASSVKQANK